MLHRLILIGFIIARVGFCESMSNESANFCMTKECIASAHNMLESMDESVDPCDDFYQYACGGFIKMKRISDDESSISHFNILENELQLQLRDILESPHDDKESIVFKNVKNVYKSCMNEDELEKLGLDPLKNELDQLGSWPVLNDEWDEVNFDWKKTIYQIRRLGYSSSYLVSHGIQEDVANNTVRIIYLDHPKFGINREYLAKGFDEERVKKYYDYMVKVAVLFGADPVKAAKDLRDSLGFEIKLAKASLSQEESRDIMKLYYPIRLNELDTMFPAINFTEYIHEILPKNIVEIKENEKVALMDLHYFKNLTKLIREEPRKNIANYIFGRMVLSSVPLLNKNAQNLNDEYLNSVEGTSVQRPRWKKCISKAKELRAALGSLYVRKYFSEDAKNYTSNMIKYLRKEFQSIIEKVKWMDSITKNNSLVKLTKINEHIGYPDELTDNSKLEELYNGLSINSNTYYKNIRNMYLWNAVESAKKLREKVDKNDWKSYTSVAVINAFYDPSKNSIQFPAGILQGVYFNKDRPQYLNFGRIGMIVGHELTHGFDDIGKQFDSEGNLNEWWMPETNKKYKEKSKCIVEQYGNYKSEKLDIYLNGINTQGENIADNGGIKEAYGAYLNWEKENGKEAILPGLNLNPRQLFWLGAANTWCFKSRPEYEKSTITTDSHSPAEFRVIGSFSNSKEFNKDFNCPEKSRMNRKNKCSVW